MDLDNLYKITTNSKMNFVRKCYNFKKDPTKMLNKTFPIKKEITKKRNRFVSILFCDSFLTNYNESLKSLIITLVVVTLQE